MKYAKPEIRKVEYAVDAIQRAQDKGGFSIVDFVLFLFIPFATPFAHEADE
jgi:hypothetical protein